MDLTTVIPQPVPLSLGGRVFLASEFRLSDLAELQGWVNSQGQSPFEQHADTILHGVRDKEWKQTLFNVIDDQEAYSPDLNSPRSIALLDSDAGKRKQILIGLRRFQPEIDQFQIFRLFSKITVSEYDRFCRVVWAIDPMTTIRHIIDGPDDSPRKPINWQSVWYRYLQTATGSAPAFSDLTITQLRAFQNAGEADSGEAVREDWQEVAERRKRFWREGDE